MYLHVHEPARGFFDFNFSFHKNSLKNGNSKPFLIFVLRTSNISRLHDLLVI